MITPAYSLERVTRLHHKDVPSGEDTELWLQQGGMSIWHKVVQTFTERTLDVCIIKLPKIRNKELIKELGGRKIMLQMQEKK